jgi:hypothetical protein
MIDKQARHITRLVDDLLDVSRLELGKVELRRQRFDLNESVAASGFLQCRRTHHDGVCRGAQQSHDEAVALIEPADIATAGLSRYRETDDSVQRADEISNHVRAPAARSELKVSSVSHAEIVGHYEWCDGLLPFKKGTNQRHGKTQDIALFGRGKTRCSPAGTGFWRPI